MQARVFKVSSISPNFKDWRERDTISVWEIAALMGGFDPRALTNVVVRDTENPNNSHGVSPDFSWTLQVLISAIAAGNLVTAPANVAAADTMTVILKASLVSWLRSRGDVPLADELDSSSQANGSTTGASTVPIKGTSVVWTQERKSAAKKMLHEKKSLGIKAFAAETAASFGVSPARLREVLIDNPKQSVKTKSTPW